MRKRPTFLEQPEDPQGCAYLIALLRAALGLSEPPCRPEGLSWEQVFRAAAAHRVENMTFSVVEQPLRREAPQVFRQWETRRRQNMVQTLAQQAAGEELLERLSGAGVRVIQLKGMELRRYYPRADWRQMSDLDLFVGPEQLPRAEAVLRRMGWQKSRLDADYHRGYEQPPWLHAELHERLIQKEERQLEFFARPWSRAQPDPAGGFGYLLEPEGFYLFMMAHLAHHRSTPEFSLRALLDLYFYRRARGEQLDRETVADGLKKLRLTRFAREAEALAGRWFGPQPPGPVGTGASRMEWEILHSPFLDSYGLERGWALVRAGRAGGPLRKKAVFLLCRLFPARWKLEQSFPVLRRHPVLLPLCWLRRLGRGLTAERGRTGAELRGLNAKTKQRTN